MRYRVIVPLDFVDDTAPRRDGKPTLVTLESGVVVEALTQHDLSREEAQHWKRIQANAQKADQNARLIAFRWLGKFRTAVIGRHVRAVTTRMGREV